jgi:diphthine synthase
VPVQVIHNVSIINAVGCTGMQLYRFGEVVSIVFFTDTWRPESFYDKIAQNRRMGLHTLCLLDIKVKEQSMENLCRGRKIYEPPRYMSVAVAAQQLIEVAHNKRAAALAADPPVAGEPCYDENTIAVGVARIGHPDQLIISGTLKELATTDFGAPLHSLIIPGELHELEAEFLNCFRPPLSTTSSSPVAAPSSTP